jgi:hypothetical protein
VENVSKLDLNQEQVREAAILILALDYLLFDHADLENAIRWARGTLELVDTDPMWANGKHEGTCTKKPFTCLRCMLEDLEDRVRGLWLDQLRLF